MDKQRQQFEEAATAPPFEASIDRQPEDSAWAGQYKDINVELAWEMWQAAQKALQEQDND